MCASNAFLLILFFSCSSGMKDGQLNRKDELYNDLVDVFCGRGVTFPRNIGTKGEESNYIIQASTPVKLATQRTVVKWS